MLPARMIRSAHESLLPYFFLIGQQAAPCRGCRCRARSSAARSAGLQCRRRHDRRRCDRCRRRARPCGSSGRRSGPSRPATIPGCRSSAPRSFLKVASTSSSSALRDSRSPDRAGWSCSRAGGDVQVQRSWAHHAITASWRRYCCHASPALAGGVRAVLAHLILPRDCDETDCEGGRARRNHFRSSLHDRGTRPKRPKPLLTGSDSKDRALWEAMERIDGDYLPTLRCTIKFIRSACGTRSAHAPHPPAEVRTPAGRAHETQPGYPVRAVFSIAECKKTRHSGVANLVRPGTVIFLQPAAPLRVEMRESRPLRRARPAGRLEKTTDTIEENNMSKKLAGLIVLGLASATPAFAARQAEAKGSVEDSSLNVRCVTRSSIVITRAAATV